MTENILIAEIYKNSVRYFAIFFLFQTATHLVKYVSTVLGIILLYVFIYFFTKYGIWRNRPSMLKRLIWGYLLSIFASTAFILGFWFGM